MLPLPLQLHPILHLFQLVFLSAALTAAPDTAPDAILVTNGPADTRDGTTGNLSASIYPAASTFNTLDAVGEANLPNGLLARFSF
jgi:hypothetical protein